MAVGLLLLCQWDLWTFSMPLKQTEVTWLTTEKKKKSWTVKAVALNTPDLFKVKMFSSWMLCYIRNLTNFVCLSPSLFRREGWREVFFSLYQQPLYFILGKISQSKTVNFWSYWKGCEYCHYGVRHSATVCTLLIIQCCEEKKKMQCTSATTVSSELRETKQQPVLLAGIQKTNVLHNTEETGEVKTPQNN